MLDTSVLKQLNDPDPGTRKEAVIALAKTLDENALSYLATVHKKDRDPEIRQLAKKAGIYIRKHTRDLFSDMENSDSNASPFYEEVDAEDLAEVEKSVKVSVIKVERAKGMVDRALDAEVGGDKDRAIDLLRRALKLNPNLKKDPFFLSQASNLTGTMSGEMAVDLLLKDEEKKKRGDEGGEDSSWSNAFIDLLIYGLVNAALIGVSVYLTFAIILPSMTEALTRQLIELEERLAAQGQAGALTAAMNGMSVPEYVESSLNNFTISATLIYSAVGSFVTIATMIIFYLFIHAMSRGILGGVGSYPRLVTKATLPLTAATVVITVLSLPVSVMTLSSPELGWVSVAVSLVLALFYYVVFSRRIGVAYGFSAFTGCGAIILSLIAMFAMGFGLGYILIALLTNGIGVR